MCVSIALIRPDISIVQMEASRWDWKKASGLVKTLQLFSSPNNAKHRIDHPVRIRIVIPT
jgi:hypothetical protein